MFAGGMIEEFRIDVEFSPVVANFLIEGHVAADLPSVGIEAVISHAPNPRKELETHYYNAKHTKLLDLGLQPRLLNDELIDTMLGRIQDHRDRIDPTTLVQDVRWVPAGASAGAGSAVGVNRR